MIRETSHEDLLSFRCDTETFSTKREIHVFVRDGYDTHSLVYSERGDDYGPPDLQVLRAMSQHLALSPEFAQHLGTTDLYELWRRNKRKHTTRYDYGPGPFQLAKFVTETLHRGALEHYFEIVVRWIEPPNLVDYGHELGLVLAVEPILNRLHDFILQGRSSQGLVEYRRGRWEVRRIGGAINTRHPLLRVAKRPEDGERVVIEFYYDTPEIFAFSVNSRPLNALEQLLFYTQPDAFREEVTWQSPT